jgi:hypothetical protein
MTTPNIPNMDGGWLAKCLTEVGAYKQFVTLPNGKNATQTAEKEIRKFSIYTG